MRANHGCWTVYGIAYGMLVNSIPLPLGIFPYRIMRSEPRACGIDS